MAGLHFTSGIDKGFERDLLRMNKQLNSFANNVTKQGESMSRMFSTIGIGFSFVQLSQVGREIANITGEFQQLQVAYETMLRSKERADKLMAQSVELAISTPFRLTEVAAGAKQLLAYGFAAEDITENLRRLGDVAAGLSIPLNDLIWVYGTTRTQGRLYARDLLQFTSRGIPLLEELAKQFNVTTSEVYKLVSAGKVGFPEVEKALYSLTGETGMFYDLMRKQSKTITGQISNMGNAWDLAFNRIGQGNLDLIEGIISVGKFAADNLEDIIVVVGSLVAAVGVYKTSMLLANGALSKSFLSLNTIIKANPIGAIASALTLAIPLIINFTKETDELKLATQEINKEVSDEIIKLKFITDSAKEAAIGTEERKRAIDSMNNNYGKYLDNLLTEKSTLQDIEKAQKKATEALIKDISAKLSKQKLDDTLLKLSKEFDASFGDYIELISETYGPEFVAQFIGDINKAVDKGLSTGKVSNSAFQVYDKYIDNISKKTGYLKNDFDGFRDAFMEFTKIKAEKTPVLETLQATVNAYTSAVEALGTAVPTESGIDDKTRDLLLEQLEVFYQDRQNLINDTANKEKKDDIERKKELLAAELWYLNEKLKLEVEALDISKDKGRIIDISFELAKLDETDPEKLLTLDYNKELLILKQFYTDKKKLQNEYDLDVSKKTKKLTTQYNYDLLLTEKRFLEKKLSLYVENRDAEKEIETKLRLEELNEQIDIESEAVLQSLRDKEELIFRANQEILRLEKALQTDITNLQAEEYKKRIEEQKQIIKDNSPYQEEQSKNKIADITDVIGFSFSQLNTELGDLISDLANSIVHVFDTFNNEASSSGQKVTSLIGLISKVLTMMGDAVVRDWSEESASLNTINKEAAARISIEAKINSLLQERRELELNSSAFLAANYKDVYSGAISSMTGAQNTLKQTLDALRTGVTVGATGTGDGLFGLNEVSKEFSFTMDEILKGAQEGATGVEKVLNFILDPLDLFGYGAKNEAYADAFTKASAGVNIALNKMGKTSADMARFSSQEWETFYVLLNEGGFIIDEGTKALISSMQDARAEYEEALEQMKNVINDIAGELGDSLGDSIVSSINDGTDALHTFGDSLNRILLDLAKAEMNELFFRGLFDNLQAEMNASMQGGDMNWQDDLLRFYDQLPPAISGAEDFLRNFDAQMKSLGFAGTEGGEKGSTNTVAGRIQQSITEETGTELTGRLGAIMLSNERIADISLDMLDYAMQHLVTLNRIRENTDYLPQIADNTKKTYQKLETLG